MDAKSAATSVAARLESALVGVDRRAQGLVLDLFMSLA